MDTLLQIKNLSKYFEDNINIFSSTRLIAVENINFELQRKNTCHNRKKWLWKINFSQNDRWNYQAECGGNFI